MGTETKETDISEKIERLKLLEDLKKEKEARTKKERIKTIILIAFIIACLVQALYATSEYYFLRRDMRILQQQMNEMASEMRTITENQ